MKPQSRELFAHLATALSRYTADLKRDGVTPPPELLETLLFFADCARTRQEATPVAGSGRSLDGVPMPTPSLLLTKREAAAELRVSVRQLERLVAADRLRTVRVEGAVRVRRVDLDAYVSGLAGGSFRDHLEEKTG